MSISETDVASNEYDSDLNPKNKKNGMMSHPRGLYILSFAEMWERFSYYGMRSLLILYFTSELLYTDNVSYAIYGTYALMAWGACVIGGIVADKMMGFFRTIIFGSAIIMIGYILLALHTNQLGLFCGLAFVATGTGFFKSNASSLVGALYPQNSDKRDAGFTLFYTIMSFGSFIAPIICSIVALKYGWHQAFGLAGFGMFIGFMVLLYFRRYFDNIGQLHSKEICKKHLINVYLVSFITIFIFVIVIYYNEYLEQITGFAAIIFVLSLINLLYKSNNKERKSIFIIIFGMIVLMLSGAFLEQHATVIALFIKRNADKNIFGYEVPAPAFQSIEPITILVFGPIVSWIWDILSKYKIQVSLISKCSIAFFLIGIGFYILHIGCLSCDINYRAPIIIVLLASMLISFSDLLIYPVILSVASKEAPERMKGFIMGAVMLSIAFSQVFSVIISKFASIDAIALNYDGLDLSSESLRLYDELFVKEAYLCFAVVAILFLSNFFIRFFKKKGKI